jgi:hypothetical protein
MCPVKPQWDRYKIGIMGINFTFKQKRMRQLEGQLRKAESIMKGREIFTRHTRKKA